MKTQQTVNGIHGTVINVPLFVPDVELDYILSGCFEGGSNYWINKVEVKDNDYRGKEYASEVVSVGGALIITEDRSEERLKNVKHELTKEKLLVGILTYANKEHGIDFDAMDAGIYDSILQYAIFGEPKYG